MKETIVHCFESIILCAIPAPAGILLKKIQQWPSHICVVCTTPVQVIVKFKPLMQVLLVLWNRTVDNRFNTSRICSHSLLPNETLKSVSRLHKKCTLMRRHTAY